MEAYDFLTMIDEEYRDFSTHLPDEDISDANKDDVGEFELPCSNHVSL